MLCNNRKFCVNITYRLILLLWLNGTALAANYLQNTYSKSVIEDASLDTAQLLAKYKYPGETHYVTTKDNYILQMHRIAKPGAPPVFMMHGLMDSSSTWIITGIKRALGYYLFDSGYDVWMGNARGNRYSRNHTTLDPNVDRSFWTFSWHEIGMYDLPAMIDYVLQHTGYAKTGYFGHSQGTTAFWVMSSMNPEYNGKITLMHALAPVAFMKHIKSPLVPMFKNMIISSKDRFTELMPRNDIFWRACFNSKVTENACLSLYYQLVGNDGNELDMTTLPAIVGQLPSGCNMKQGVHYVQLVDSDRFCQYDWGWKENLRRYGNSSPPDYPLEKITAPVALYYTYNDYMSSEEDVKRLAKSLPNVVEDCLYPYKKWNHMTMCWGVDARELAHKKMLQIMKDYSYE